MYFFSSINIAVNYIYTASVQLKRSRAASIICVFYRVARSRAAISAYGLFIYISEEITVRACLYSVSQPTPRRVVEHQVTNFISLPIYENINHYSIRPVSSVYSLYITYDTRVQFYNA